MNDKTFSRYLKISFMISFLIFYRVKAMEEDSTSSEQLFCPLFQENCNLNFLGYLPPELLLNIIKILSPDDSGFKYLKKYYKILYKVIPKEFAELSMDKLWKNFILTSNNLKEVKQVIEEKYRCLEINFPNYNMLHNAFVKIIISRYRDLVTLSKDVSLSLKLNLEQKNWLEFNNIISKLDIFNITSENDNKEICLKFSKFVIEDIRNNLIFSVFKQIAYKAIKEKKVEIFILGIGCLLTGLFFKLLSLNDFCLEPTAICIGIALCLNLIISIFIIRYHIIKPIFRMTIAKINLVLKELECSDKKSKDAKLMVFRN